MSAGTKVAAFAAFIRVFNISFQPITWDWQPVVWILAAVSIVAGSVLAIAQTDIKRMLAYSSISHAGFVLLGLTAAGEDGISAALFYLVAYAATVIGAFGVVMVVSARGERHTRSRPTPGSPGGVPWRPACSPCSCSRSPGSRRRSASWPRWRSSGPRPRPGTGRWC